MHRILKMAQTDISKPATVGHAAPVAPTEKELHAWEQYTKIIRFRDAVLAGSHPTIKVPESLRVSVHSSQVSDDVSRPNAQDTADANTQAFSSNAKKAAVSFPTPQRAGVVPPAPRSGKVEINPIFLEKSDDLIRAEILLQRHRIERALKEEAEQRRTAKQPQGQESAPEVDPSDVLAKAQLLIQASAVPLPADDNLTASNEAASDSFDDNTFYSSRHDTPFSHSTSRAANENETTQPADASSHPRSNGPSGAAGHVLVSSIQGNQVPAPPTGPSISRDVVATASANIPQPCIVPGLNNYPERAVSSTGPSQFASGEQSQSDDSGRTDLDLARARAPTTIRPQLDDSYAELHPPSPLIRTRNPPHAVPQAARSTDLTMAASQATSPQVAALRGDRTAATSPESSPQAAKGSEKKKGKKKKRKADRQVSDTDATPYIKPEPRSVSPVAAPPYARPYKRQRQGQRPAPETPGAAYSPSRAVVVGEEHQPRHYVDQVVPAAFEGAHPRPQRAASAVVVGDTRHGRYLVGEQPAPEAGYLGQHVSPRAPSTHYAPGATPVGRPVSHIVIDDPYQEPHQLPREPYEVARVSVRPEYDMVMAPPPRIVVDAYGREYIEPPRYAARQSLAPSYHPREPSIIYERAPPRALSRHPIYDEWGKPYGEQLSQLPPPAPRRVVTQPEYGPNEYASRGYREVSTARAAGPLGDYVQVIGPPERVVVEDARREYLSRSASVRPAENVRYEVPYDYGRVQSVRPEAPVRVAGYPEGPRELAQPYLRDYSVRPVEQHVLRQGYGAHPVHGYREPQPAAGGDVTFIERPPGAPIDAPFPEDGRRDVYR
ncbi:hypothetical protein B0I35DRAFT_416717 [Stachybotrys elegans]|uniref:Uncharacterized protein n=1 Tax=Stachybotrys elegans TaxID=80388 RepID=A0A8K0T0A0_9HYPO|nr:hypothetical protein B0I35DRAFT_416717 [Stachybotrys elegans]